MYIYICIYIIYMCVPLYMFITCSWTDWKTSSKKVYRHARSFSFFEGTWRHRESSNPQWLTIPNVEGRFGALLVCVGTELGGKTSQMMNLSWVCNMYTLPLKELAT